MHQWFGGALLIHCGRPIDMVQYHSDEGTAFLPWREWLGKKISGVVMCIDVGGTPLITGNTLTDEMVGNAVAFLFQCGLGNRCVSKDRFVITIYECRSATRDTHHLKLESETTKILKTEFHSNKLGAEGAGLDTCLLFGKPIDG